MSFTTRPETILFTSSAVFPADPGLAVLETDADFDISRYRVLDGAIVPVTEISPADIAAAVARINASADMIRRQFVTDLAGQELLYLKKEAQARAYLALTEPPDTMDGYGLIAAEVGITAPDATSVAQVILNLADQWVQVAARLETWRLGSIDTLRQAADLPSLMALLDRCQRDFATFRPHTHPHEVSHG